MSSYGGGYMCEFRVRQDNNMLLTDYRDEPQNSIRFLFRVQYFLRKKPGFGADEIVDSIGALYSLDLDQPLVEEHLEMFMALDFARWGLPYSVRRTLYRDVANHVQLMKSNPENAGCTVLPIDVAIDIYTVQREDEDIEVTRSRLMKSRTFAFVSAAELPEYQVSCSVPVEEKSPLIDLLEKVRVEDNEYVQECSICLEKPCVGAEICYLPCTHAYHYLCIIRWLEKSHICPFCRAFISN